MPKHIPMADLSRTSTWVKYRKGLCNDCFGTCCTMPVEVRLDDLIRMGLAEEFDRDEPAKKLAKRLEKAGLIEHFNFKHEIYTLRRKGNGDCQYLHPTTRLCTIYEKRPNTCRNHPKVGPRPGYCAYRQRN